MENAYHYQTIARALAYLRAHAEERPSLEDVASAVGFSQYHFQRVFSEWVGVSPKAYLEHLQLAQAKPILRERMGTFQAAHSAGLSGTGRLYDLLIKWEGVTPGEFAEGAASFSYGVADTPFGAALFVATKRGLAALAFVDADVEPVLAEYRARWPRATFVPDDSAIAPYAEAFGAMRGEVPVTLIGTPFQLQVWRALLALPEARFTTYGDLAQGLGKPNAARAVGTAVGRNPVSLLVPCHRVIRQTGELGGYHWGLPRKEAMIAFESARAQ